MKPLLDKHGLDRRPHDINKNVWYYEEKSGLVFYDNTGKVKTISWRTIEAALKRVKGAK